jgi:hypothetical protein
LLKEKVGRKDWKKKLTKRNKRNEKFGRRKQ